MKNEGHAPNLEIISMYIKKICPQDISGGQQPMGRPEE